MSARLIQRLFPARADRESYAGRPAALWLLGLFIALKAIIGLNGTFNARSVATGADGIVLDGLGEVAIETILQLFRALSLAQLPLVLIGVAVLLRWRSMAPFLFLVLLTEQFARRLLAAVQAAPREAAAPGSWISLGLLLILILGLALSLWPRKHFRP
ncbi:MAG TPA: hypothetical protein VGB79_11095 [Allosphingosinicella sp.]|jgi:hypothetical protein